MTLLTPLKKDKPAHAEPSVIRHPASCHKYPSPIPSPFKRTIIRPALLLILLIFSAFSVLAYDCEVDGIYYKLNTTNRTASVTSSDGWFVDIPKAITYSYTTYSVTSIDICAFYGCDELVSVTIPNSVTSIGAYAFYGCSELTSVTIPNSVTSIGDGPFNNCSRLISVVVDKNNGTYDSRNNCNAIIETSTNKLVSGCKNTIIPNSVTSIGSCAFYGCSGLTSVTIPNSVTSIGNGAFDSCSGLPSVVIGNSVTAIGEEAFYDCSGLTSVTIGNSVTSIAGLAFAGCKKLTKLVSLAVEPPVCGDKAFAYVNKAACQLLVPKESVNKYKAADQWKEFKYISECSSVDDVSVDTQDALYEVYNLQGVRVGSGMREAEITADALPHSVYLLVSPQGRKKLKI